MNPSGPTSAGPKSTPLIPRSIETDDGVTNDTGGTDGETDDETDRE